MARKSAASVKPVKSMKAEPLVPIEEVFATGKEGITLIVETNITTAKRVDNLLNIRDYALKFFEHSSFEPDIAYYKELQKISVETYEKVLEIVKGMELDQFLPEELDDLFADIMPKAEDMLDEHDLCKAGIVYLSVKPYGNQIIRLHKMIQDELGKRKAMEG